MASEGETDVYGPHTDPPVESRPFFDSVQTFRHAMTRLCRTIGDEDILKL